MTLYGRAKYMVAVGVLADFTSEARLTRRGSYAFFSWCKIMGAVKKQNEHDDPSSETAVFLIKSSYNAAALIDSRRKQKSR